MKKILVLKLIKHGTFSVFTILILLEFWHTSFWPLSMFCSVLNPDGNFTQNFYYFLIPTTDIGWVYGLLVLQACLFESAPNVQFTTPC